MNLDSQHNLQIAIKDHSYKSGNLEKMLDPAGRPGDKANLILNIAPNFGWYDFSIKAAGNNHFERRYAGRVETGQPGFSDPFMGRITA